MSTTVHLTPWRRDEPSLEALRRAFVRHTGAPVRVVNTWPAPRLVCSSPSACAVEDACRVYLDGAHIGWVIG